MKAFLVSTYLISELAKHYHQNGQEIYHASRPERKKIGKVLDCKKLDCIGGKVLTW